MLSCFGRSPTKQRKSTFGNLDQTEVHTMKENWQLLCSSRQVGQEILASLISNNIEFASFFGIDTEHLDQMKNSEKFRIQARRIESLIDTTITSMGIVPQQIINQTIRNVGKIHFYHGVNFSTENWKFFERTLSAELEKGGSHGWETLVDMIVNEMKLGFFLEMTAQFEETRFLSPTTQPLRKGSDPLPRRKISVKGKGTDLSTNSDSVQASSTNLGQKGVMLCRESWNEANRADIGMKILLALINNKPAFAEHFGVEAGLGRKGLEEHPRLKIQASRIHGLINTVIALYGVVPENKIREMCAHIGQTHFHRGVNFTADNWLVFKRVTIEQVLEAVDASRQRSEHKSMLLRKAWHELMAFIVRAMKDGFLVQAAANATV